MQQDHMVNKKGQTIDFLNFNSHVPTPVFMSKGDYDALQKRLAAAPGRAPTPPEFSLGYLHSKLRYENQTEILHLADNFVRNDIPVSMLIIDYESWAQNEKTGAEMMASLWPAVEDDSVNYSPMQRAGFLSATKSGPGTTDAWNGSYIRLYDATNPDARKFLWETLHKNYYEKGIKNFWIDQADGGALGEALTNTAQFGYVASIPYALPDLLYAAGTQKSVGKLYPWAHQQAIEEGLRNATGMKQGTPCDSHDLVRRHIGLVADAFRTDFRRPIAKNFTTQQYMLGPRLLVAPVTLPNVTEWEVYLPRTAAGNGTKPWTYWWTNQTYAGGQNVTVPAPLEHIPLFHLGTKEDIFSGDVYQAKNVRRIDSTGSKWKRRS
ncbi:hypothetical protein VF21_03303 [Pseudogymnoascus sp. 05NY08]|nr:hypothetical protein VF21_03303 [Pseudogymnoascus sp. 05NY08]